MELFIYVFLLLLVHKNRTKKLRLLFNFRWETKNGNAYNKNELYQYMLGYVNYWLSYEYDDKIFYIVNINTEF